MVVKNGDQSHNYQAPYQQTADSPEKSPNKKGNKNHPPKKLHDFMGSKKKTHCIFFPHSSSPPPASGLQKAAIE